MQRARNNYTCLNTNGCIGSPGARGYHDHQGKQGPPAPQGPQGPQGQPGPQGTGDTRTIRSSRATEVTRVTRDTGATRVTKDTGAARTTKGNQVHQGKNQWIEFFKNWPSDVSSSLVCRGSRFAKKLPTIDCCLFSVCDLTIVVYNVCMKSQTK